MGTYYQPLCFHCCQKYGKSLLLKNKHKEVATESITVPMIRAPNICLFFVCAKDPGSGDGESAITLGGSAAIKLYCFLIL